jgi:uncharacterized protein (DUF305 family)
MYTGKEGNVNQNHYPKLLTMSVLSLISMYILMYSMVDTFDNLYNNFNKFYMAMIMTAPMVVFELLLMKAMYPNQKLNAVLIVGSLAALAIFFLFIRQQTAIHDKQFLRSMIPHHSSAILMCQQAKLADAEIQGLCESIIDSQQQEIDQMRAIMQRLEE